MRARSERDSCECYFQLHNPINTERTPHQIFLQKLGYKSCESVSRSVWKLVFFRARAPPDVEVDVVFGGENISTSPGNLRCF